MPFVLTWLLWHKASWPVVRHRPHFELVFSLPDQVLATIDSSLGSGRFSLFIEFVQQWQEWNGVSYDSVMTTQLLWFIALLLAMYFLGRQVANERVALLAVAVTALTPAFFGASLEFNDHLMNLTVVAVGLALFCVERPPLRWLAIAVAGVVFALDCLSALVMSNAAIVGIVLSAGLISQELFRREIEPGKGLLGRFRRAFLFLLVFWTPALFALLAVTGQINIGYFFDQLLHFDAPPFSFGSFIAYFPVTFLYQLGPAIGLALIIALSAGKRLPIRQKALLIGSLIAPYLLLSLIGKKTEWYVLYPLVSGPIIISEALFSLRIRVWRFAAIGLLLIAASAWFSYRITVPRYVTADPIGHHYNPFGAFERQIVGYLIPPITEPDIYMKTAFALQRLRVRAKPDTRFDVSIIDRFCHAEFLYFIESAAKPTSLTCLDSNPETIQHALHTANVFVFSTEFITHSDLIPFTNDLTIFASIDNRYLVMTRN